MSAGALESYVMRCAPHLYRAAVAAASDPSVAANVVERVLREETRQVLASGAFSDEQALLAKTVRLAVAVAPGDGFCLMRPEHREVVALARLGGCSSAAIAELLGTDVQTVKARMSRGLECVAAATVRSDDGRRTPPLRRGCENGASPVRVERASLPSPR